MCTKEKKMWKKTKKKGEKKKGVVFFFVGVGWGGGGGGGGVGFQVLRGHGFNPCLLKFLEIPSLNYTSNGILHQ